MDKKQSKSHRQKLLLDTSNQYSLGGSIINGITSAFKDQEGVSSILDAAVSGMNNLATANKQKFQAQSSAELSDYKSLVNDRNTFLKNYTALQQAAQDRLQKNTSNQYALGGLVSAAIGIDNAAGSLIGGNYQSGVGNALKALPGGGIIGGTINRLFGSQTNEAELSRVKGDVSYLNNAAASAGAATSFDDASLNGPQAVNFNVQAYKGGLFSGGSAKKKNRELQNQLKEGYQFAQNAAVNGINNVASNQMSNLNASYAAYGGPLEYDLNTTLLNNMYMNAGDSKIPAMPNSFSKNSMFAYGGTLMTHGADWNNNLTWVNNGGTHEQNPQSGVPMGIAPDGQPNLVEEGEVVYKDYVFSDRLKVPEKLRARLKVNKNATFAEAAKKAGKESEERPNDPISQAGLQNSLQQLLAAQEEIRQKRQNKKIAKQTEQAVAQQQQMMNMGLMAQPNNPFAQQMPQENSQEYPQELMQNNGEEYALGGHLKDGTDTTQQLEKMKQFLKSAPKPSYEDTAKWLAEVPPLKTWFRYVPTLGGALGFGLSYLPADYSNAKRLEDAAAAINNGNRDMISFNPIGNYLTYRPDDINYTANQLRASEQATNRNLLNTASGNSGAAMAGLIANGYKSQLALGDAYRNAFLANREQEQKVEDFNRATNIANSQGFLEAAKSNQATRMQNRNQYLAAIEAAAKMRQSIDDNRDQSRAANLSNFFNSIGNIGRENMAFNMVNGNKSQYYGINSNGTIYYKPAAYDSNGKLKQEAINELTNAAINGRSTKAAYGGMLTKRSKKGGKR